MGREERAKIDCTTFKRLSRTANGGLYDGSPSLSLSCLFPGTKSEGKPKISSIADSCSIRSESFVFQCASEVTGLTIPRHSAPQSMHGAVKIPLLRFVHCQLDLMAFISDPLQLFYDLP